MLAAWLLCIARAVSAVVRLSVGPLLPLLAAEFEIGMSAKGQLLAAFSQGYLLTQVGGGYLADRVGAKVVVLAALTITGAGMMATPLVADSHGVAGFTCMYFALGVVSGPLFPCCSVMLRNIPPGERSQAMAIVDAGGTIGGCMATAICPAVATILGWRRLFHLLAAVALGTAAVWQWKATNPEATTPEVSVDAESKAATLRGNPLMLLTFAGPWALFCSHAVFNYSNYFLNAWLPTMYVERFADVSAAKAGAYLVWPELAGILTRMSAAFLTDRLLLGPGLLSLLTVRRGASLLGFLVQGAALVLSTQVAEPLHCTAFLTLAAAASGFHACGFKANYLDLTSAHSGLLAGVGNTLASISSAAGPVITSAILGAFPGNWELLFGGLLGLNLLGSSVVGRWLSVESLDAAVAAGQKKEL